MYRQYSGNSISVSHLSLEIKKQHILKDISLSVRQKEKCVIYGPSGSGKTSLIRSLLGMYQEITGGIEIGGLRLDRENMASIRQLLCYIPQSIHIFGDETAREFIEMPFSFKANNSKVFSSEKLSMFLDVLALKDDILSQRMATLSGGEKQRAALARALMLDRRIMILDEVTSAIDANLRIRIIDYLLSLEQVTILSVSHDHEWIKKSDHRIELKNGRIIDQGFREE